MSKTKTRKPYRGPQHARDLEGWARQDGLAEAKAAIPNSPAAKGPVITVRKPALEPSKINKIPRWHTKAGIFAAGTAATGGTAYLVHHRRNAMANSTSTREVNKGVKLLPMPPRKAPPWKVAKPVVAKLYDPFAEESVVFEKDWALPIKNVSRPAALVPTGKHVSHANALKVVRRKGSLHHMPSTSSPLQVFHRGR